jgi:hypothetical protein
MRPVPHGRVVLHALQLELPAEFVPIHGGTSILKIIPILVYPPPVRQSSFGAFLSLSGGDAQMVMHKNPFMRHNTEK